MRPNILFIMADQFRADAMGCAGGHARTPNLDRLAARGLRFDSAYANSAECVPSRVSLATGLYPHQTGVDRNANCTLEPDFPNWMQALAAVGYRTSLFGKTHLHPHVGDLRDRLGPMHDYGLQHVDETAGPRALTRVGCNLTDLWQKHGVWEAYKADFADRFAHKPFVARPSTLPLELYYDRYVGHAARQYLQALELGGPPWFCWLSFGGPHEPWDAPQPYASLYAPETMPKPRPRRQDTSGLRGLLKLVYESTANSPPGLALDDIAALRANYAGNVKLIDDEIGAVLDVIETRGEMDRTLVVFASDHGEMNGDEGLLYKMNSLDPVTRVPLVVAPPRGSAGVRGASTAMVELMDVGATMLDYADGILPSISNARSLRPLIEGRAVEHRAFCLGQFGGYFCVVTPDTKVELDGNFEATIAFDRLTDPGERDDVSQRVEYGNRIAAAAIAARSLIGATPPVDGAARCVSV